MEIILSLQLQMEKLPSRKAITKMISWMNKVEHQTTREDSEHSLSSASQVKNLLQKHRVKIRKWPGAFSGGKKASQWEGKWWPKRHVGSNLENLFTGEGWSWLTLEREAAILLFFSSLDSFSSSHHMRLKPYSVSDPLLFISWTPIAKWCVAPSLYLVVSLILCIWGLFCFVLFCWGLGRTVDYAQEWSPGAEKLEVLNKVSRMKGKCSGTPFCSLFTQNPPLEFRALLLAIENSWVISPILAQLFSLLEIYP